MPSRAAVEPAESPSLRGRVLTEGGQPVSGALVTWLALQQEDTEETPSWPLASWGSVSRTSVATTAGPDGFFAFDRAPQEPLPFGSVLIALHDSHYPGGLDLPVDPGEWPGLAQLRVEASTPISVRVVDASGSGQAGALVRHSAVPRRPTPEAPSPVPLWEHFLYQEGDTDSNGEMTLAPFRGEQALWAEKEERVSVPWQGPRPKSVRLTLGESFNLGGSLALPDLKAWDPNYEGERRILVTGRTWNLWRTLACLRDVQDGTWGPLTIPLSGVSGFRVRLEGLPVVPIEEAFDPPRPRSHRRIDFHAEKAVDLWFLVQDESGRPIPTARGVVWWSKTALPTEPERVEGAAKPDGSMYLGSFPAGTIGYRISAPGYGTVEGMEQVPREGIQIFLPKGGRIEGHCTHDGSPVTDFEVIYWEPGPRADHTRSFFGREDGSFELDALKLGEWSLFAASPDFPSGRPMIVRVEANETARVELELPTPIPGGGRIVDSETGEPVSRARVQPFSSGGLERSLPWGPPVPVAGDGSFELEAFVLGSNYLRVEAEGYADFDASARALDQDFLDWGDIRLFRPQELLVALVGLEGLDCAPSALRAHTMEGHILPTRNFQSDGTVRFEGVPPGSHRFLITSPDETWTRLHLELDPGREWRFEHRISGAGTLTVQVSDVAGNLPSFPILVMVTGQERSGIFTVRMNWLEKDGRFRFEGITAQTVQVWILDPDGNKHASRDVSFASESAIDLSIRLGEKPLRVHVVDADGAALPGAWVTLSSENGAEVLGIDETDSAGWASVHGASGSSALLDVSHGIAGRRLGIPIEASADEIEVVLEATGALEIRIADGAEVLPDVAVRLETKGGVRLGGAKQTDAQGLARFDSLGEGTYHLSCKRADCWTTYIDEDLDPDEHAVANVQMRRLADLELLLLDRDGIPISGASIDITSDEFGASLDAWLQEGAIRSETGSTTDTGGRIRAEGLPRGPYTWSVARGGGSLTGTFSLQPARRNEIAVGLPR